MAWTGCWASTAVDAVPACLESLLEGSHPAPGLLGPSVAHAWEGAVSAGQPQVRGAAAHH
jgi:hypothetical protein